MELKTAQEWLAYGDDLPVKLAKVFTPGPHSHDFYGGKDEPSEKCLKCNLDEDTVECFCSVPDPITIDWNVAMEWFRKAPKTQVTVIAMRSVYRFATGMRARLDYTVIRWFLEFAHPKHYLIAAAMAAERKEK